MVNFRLCLILWIDIAVSNLSKTQKLYSGGLALQEYCRMSFSYPTDNVHSVTWCQLSVSRWILWNCVSLKPYLLYWSKMFLRRSSRHSINTTMPKEMAVTVTRTQQVVIAEKEDTWSWRLTWQSKRQWATKIKQFYNTAYR
jgi:hypothetical protein